MTPPIDGFRNLVSAHGLLADTAPELAAQVRATLDARVLAACPRLSAAQASSLLFDLPLPLLEETLCLPSDTALGVLAATAAPAWPDLTTMPRGVPALSQGALERLIADGFPYDRLIKDKAAEMWLARGAAFGKRAFRAAHPRKNPVLAYWAAEGFRLPPAGLCPEGVTLVADTMHDFRRRDDTLGLRKASNAKQADIRVVFAFLRSGGEIPFLIKSRMNWPHLVGPRVRDSLVHLFQPRESGHAEMTRLDLVARTPTVEAALTMPKKDLWDHLSALTEPKTRASRDHRIASPETEDAS